MMQIAPGFIIGVDQQPIENFAMWQELGINTLVGIPNSHDATQWVQAANAAGLYQIRPPVGPPAVDAGNPLLLAWLHGDEPDLHQVPVGQLLAARAAAVNTTRAVPWLVNFDGSRVLNLQPNAPPVLKPADYQVLASAADWISSDVFPVTGWNYNIDFFSPGKAVDALRSWTNKPQLMYVECSDQQLPWVGAKACVNPGELRLLVAQAEYRKCRGIIYHPTVDGQPHAPWDKFFDGVTPTIKRAMQEINRELAATHF